MKTIHKTWCKLFGHWWNYGVALSLKDIQQLDNVFWGDYHWNKCRVCGKLEGHSYN